MQTHCTGNLKSINSSAILLDFPVSMIFLREMQEEDGYGEDKDKNRMTPEFKK